MKNDTIYALSSGQLPSGVAIIRISGPDAIWTAQKFCSKLPKPRTAVLQNICSLDGTLLDKGLVLVFPAPSSFTGEDCVELHLHGGKAVVAAVLNSLSHIPNCRLADAGEFSRRAFENGRLDLTEVEALADLIASETEHQRRQAISNAGGHFRAVLEDLRSDIIRCRALVEAHFDFSDEEDVPSDVLAGIWRDVGNLRLRMEDILDDQRNGEIIRDGYKIALMGEPNSGKSSLLNALAKRDVAIISEEAGTTRDVLEAKLDIGGVPVIISDTAGIRDTESTVEQEGIRRAKLAGAQADLVLWLCPLKNEENMPDDLPDNAVVVKTKSDLMNDTSKDQIQCSVVDEDGLDQVMNLIGNHVSEYGSGEAGLISRARHRAELQTCRDALKASIQLGSNNVELAAEELRRAGECIGRLTGQIDVEDLLDHIFSEFCIGK